MFRVFRKEVVSMLRLVEESNCQASSNQVLNKCSAVVIIKDQLVTACKRSNMRTRLRRAARIHSISDVRPLRMKTLTTTFTSSPLSVQAQAQEVTKMQLCQTELASPVIARTPQARSIEMSLSLN